MAERLIQSKTLQDIADAVKEREGTPLDEKIVVSDFASRILALTTGDSAPIYNGSFTVRETESGEEVGGSDGIQLQEKTVTENGEVTPDEGYDGLSKVIVAVPIPEETDSPLPIEVATESDMLDIIINATTDDVGAVYKYTGTTGMYESGALYIIEVSD